MKIMSFLIVAGLILASCNSRKATFKPSGELTVVPDFLTFTSVTPITGDIAGGNTITLSGTNFSPQMAVTIGSLPCTALTFASDEQVDCKVPASTIAGTLDITVTNPDEKSVTLEAIYTYVAPPASGYPAITSVSPDLGTKDGGTRITLTGTGFISGAVVKLDGKICTNLTYTNSTQLSCTTPAASPGYNGVEVHNPNGFVGVKSAAFSYVSTVMGSSVVAFQANTGELWRAQAVNTGTTSLAMKAGTSPSIALTSGGHLIAYQSPAGNLWIVGNIQIGDTGYAMMAGTSPAIVQLAEGGYQAAFQSSNGRLWLVGKHVNGDTLLEMAPNTSPAIAAIPGGGFQVLFQARSGSLWRVGTNIPAEDLSFGMAPGTSPAIAYLGGGLHQYAFQANTNKLWTVGVHNVGDTRMAMKPGTSPAMMAFGNNEFQIAFQTSAGRLFTVGAVNQDLGLGMYPTASPTIGTVAGGAGYQIGFVANTGRLWMAGSLGNYDTGLGIRDNTSPSMY